MMKTKKVSKAQAKALLAASKQPEVGTKTSIAASVGAGGKIGKAITPVVVAVPEKKPVTVPTEPAVATTPSVWATPAAGAIKSSTDSATSKPTVAAIVAGNTGQGQTLQSTVVPTGIVPVRATTAPESLVGVGPSSSDIQRSVTSTPKTGSAIPGGLASGGVTPSISTINNVNSNSNSNPNANPNNSNGTAPSNAYCPPRPAPAP